MYVLQLMDSHSSELSEAMPKNHILSTFLASLIKRVVSRTVDQFFYFLQTQASNRWDEHRAFSKNHWIL